MPIIERPNRDALRNGIDIYIDTMREFIVNSIKDASHITLPVQNQIYRDLENSHQDRYWQQLKRNDHCVESAIDIADFKRLISKNWFAIFDSLIDGDLNTVINLIDRITDARNGAFHFSKSDLDHEVVRSRIGDVTGMMRRIGAKEEEEAAIQINRQLVSVRVKSLPHCDTSFRQYVGALASRHRIRHPHAWFPVDNAVNSERNGNLCSLPYKALTFYRIRYKDPTYRPCFVTQGSRV